MLENYIHCTVYLKSFPITLKDRNPNLYQCMIIFLFKICLLTVSLCAIVVAICVIAALSYLYSCLCNTCSYLSYCSGYLHAHISYLDEQCRICLLLLTVDRDVFFTLSDCKHKIEQVGRFSH